MKFISEKDKKVVESRRNVEAAMKALRDRLQVIHPNPEADARALAALRADLVSALVQDRTAASSESVYTCLVCRDEQGERVKHGLGDHVFVAVRRVGWQEGESRETYGDLGHDLHLVMCPEAAEQLGLLQYIREE